MRLRWATLQSAAHHGAGAANYVDLAKGSQEEFLHVLVHVHDAVHVPLCRWHCSQGLIEEKRCCERRASAKSAPENGGRKITHINGSGDPTADRRCSYLFLLLEENFLPCESQQKTSGHPHGPHRTTQHDPCRTPRPRSAGGASVPAMPFKGTDCRSTQLS